MEMNHPPRWGFIAATAGKVLTLQVRCTAGIIPDLYPAIHHTQPVLGGC